MICSFLLNEKKRISLQVLSLHSLFFSFFSSAIDGASHFRLFFHRHPVYFFFASLFLSLSLSSSQAFQTVCVYVVYSQHDHFYDTYIYIYIDCTFTIRTRSSTLKCIYDQRWFDNVSLFIFIFTHTFSSSTLDLIHI